MATLTINGPTVERDRHNVVLREALFHSPVQRLSDTANYVLLEIGIREGEYTTWIGSWDQSSQKVEAGVPTSVLNPDRLGMRLKEKQAVVVRVTSTGTPATLAGSRVTFQLGLVGGRSGTAKPLVAASASVTDTNSRIGMAALERQINTGGLSDWEEPVQLIDPFVQASIGTFQGRIQRDSSTAISLQQYTGNIVEVAGTSVAITSSGIALTTSATLLTSTGGSSTSTPSASTLYYVYLATSGDMRLSATAPTRVDGIYYLGSDSATSIWRFVGWVYLNGSTQFTDSETAREVVNMYNRVLKRLFTCPAYSNGNTQTSYTQSSTSWAKLNGGTGSDVSFVVNGEDGVHLSITMRAVNSASAIHGPAIGIDGITDIETSGDCLQVGSERVHITVPRHYAPSTAGRHTASMLGRQASGTATIYADQARNGATADPAQTYLVGWVWV